MRIRPVRPAERELLLDIEREAGRAFAGVGMPEIARDDPGTVDDVADAWVAVDEDDRPVAYLTSRVVDGNAHIEQVSVAPSHARRGIGAALIDHLAAETGRPLTLTTFRDVPWNAPYYERLGFRVFEPGPELTELVCHEADRIPGDAPRVAMLRLQHCKSGKGIGEGHSRTEEQPMAQTKADRQAAAKKGAATRERNRVREESSTRGTKAAASAQSNRAAGSLDQAKHSASSAVGGVKSAAKSVGDAAKQAGKSATTRSRAGK